MKLFLLLPFLLIIVATGQTSFVSNDEAPLAVISQKWTRSRLTVAQVSNTTVPAAAMIAQNKNFERNRRANASPGERDPNLDTLDGRSAAMQRNVEASRAPKPLDGFVYRAKFRNSTPKAIEVLFWEYEFIDSANPSLISRRQFLCGVNIRPGRDKELEGFSMSGPSDVISVQNLGKPESSFQEKVVINRVEFSDGTIWQRSGWKLAEVKATYDRALTSPWAPDMCKGL